VKAILSRCYPDSGTQAQNIFKIGTFEFEPNNLVLKHSSEEKRLTQKEADVLKLLCQNLGETVKRELILSSVWGNADYFTGRSLDVFISKLRKYLKSDVNIQIENVHGVGFRLRVNQ
jgi:DNA-binding response OmpR family regulator